ncbi:MAG: YihA family ribosome biogenesis GTP-binding protein [Parachlamydiaceae bacterium]|nr:YihA family ribosome biogenesis GTP-binding protein [Parachlamydiaceae bacterium]
MKQSSKARFIKTAILPKDYPVIRNNGGNLLPEVAVAGRSNVGKSSLLNNLFQVKNLVKTSSVPGKTQALNFFTFNDNIAFTDLPGYGYASAPIHVKKEWGPMMKKYLENRETLRLILLLLDIRRIPNEEDKLFIEWAAYHQKALIIILTKTDKLNQSEKALNTKKIIDELQIENLHFVHYSVPKDRGRKELLDMIHDALEDEALSDEELE